MQSHKKSSIKFLSRSIVFIKDIRPHFLFGFFQNKYHFKIICWPLLISGGRRGGSCYPHYRILVLQFFILRYLCQLMSLLLKEIICENPFVFKIF